MDACTIPHILAFDNRRDGNIILVAFLIVQVLAKNICSLTSVLVMRKNSRIITFCFSMALPFALVLIISIFAKSELHQTYIWGFPFSFLYLTVVPESDAWLLRTENLSNLSIDGLGYLLNVLLVFGLLNYISSRFTNDKSN